MENNNNSVSFVAFEATCTRFDRIIKRLTIALVVCIILVFASNAVWLYAWMQYDYSSTEETTTTETVTIDGKDGTANYANHGGSVINGTNNSAYDYEDSEDQNEDTDWQN